MSDPSRTDPIEPNPTAAASPTESVEPNPSDVDLISDVPCRVAPHRLSSPPIETPSAVPEHTTLALDREERPKRRPSQKKQRSPSEAQAAPKNIADLHGKTKMRREWFARIRIREDRLARLWVSNLVGHDVVVWSSKEKRWVALLGVPELRRALRLAELELSTNSGRSSETQPLSLAQPPHVLPPTPPLALLNSAQAGVGEFRLRSIAQAQNNVKSRDIGWRKPAWLEPQLAFVRNRNARQRPSEHDENFSLLTDDQQRQDRWRWGAIERVIWVGVGVLAMFVVSSAGSMDEHPTRFEPATLVLSADRNDPASEQSPGEQLLGTNFQCKIQPNEQPPNPQAIPPEPRLEDVNREPAASPLTRGRPSNDSSGRAAPPTTRRSAPESGDASAEVPTDLNFQAIRAALFNAAALAHGCPGDRVSGKAVVTFEPNGSVRTVEIPLLIGERPDRDCIVRIFKSLRVPAFSGHAVAVKKDF